MYAIHCYLELYLKVAERDAAAMYVMNDLDGYSGPGNRVPEVLEKMVEGCEGRDWPKLEGREKSEIFRGDFAFTRIYWRRVEGGYVSAVEEKEERTVVEKEQAVDGKDGKSDAVEVKDKLGAVELNDTQT